MNYSTTISDYLAYRNKRNISSCLGAATRSQRKAREAGKRPPYVYLILPFKDILIKITISFIFAYLLILKPELYLT